MHVDAIHAVLAAFHFIAAVILLLHRLDEHNSDMHVKVYIVVNTLVIR